MITARGWCRPLRTALVLVCWITTFPFTVDCSVEENKGNTGSTVVFLFIGGLAVFAIVVACTCLYCPRCACCCYNWQRSWSNAHEQQQRQRLRWQQEQAYRIRYGPAASPEPTTRSSVSSNNPWMNQQQQPPPPRPNPNPAAAAAVEYPATVLYLAAAPAVPATVPTTLPRSCSKCGNDAPCTCSTEDDILSSVT